VDTRLPEVTEKATAVAVSFVPARECDGVGGTWRGQVYSVPHAGYYEFTAKISRPDPSRPELSGSIIARSWGGIPEDVVPPDSCEDTFHWTVVEEAAGTVAEDGSLSFAGTSWHVGEHFCGEDVTDYSLDHLDVHPAADGDPAHLTGIASDTAVWVNGLGIEMTHVACE
jgi:hypothetical protein